MSANASFPNSDKDGIQWYKNTEIISLAKQYSNLTSSFKGNQKMKWFYNPMKALENNREIKAKQ